MTPTFTTPAAPHRNQTLRALILSLLFCLALYAVDLVCMALLPASSSTTYATNYALPFDLIIVIPAAFYFLVARRRKLTPILVLPVIWIGMIASLQFVQPSAPSLHLVLFPAVAVVDVVILAKEIRRFLQAFRTAHTSSRNPLDWFAHAFFTLTRNKRASHMAAMEMTIWYYLFASWRQTPDVPEGSHAFTCHKKSGYIALVGVITAMVGVETFAVHLLVAQWSEIAAILLTAASIYTALWLVSSTRAVVLNPLLVDADAVTVRWAMHFSERIPLDMIECINSQEPDVPKNQRMNLTIMGMEPCWITLREPVSLRTFTGTYKPIQAINVSPDEATTFKRLVMKGR